MSGDDFIILPNGKKLYLRDTYGAVNSKNLKNNSSLEQIIWNYDKNEDSSFSASEIRSIFNAIKNKAQEDGNNELSEKELKDFFKEEAILAEENGEAYHDIKAKDFINFLLNLQDESEKSLEYLPELEATYDLTKEFPELKSLGIGDDRHIDTSMLNFETIREKLFSDTEKYEIISDNEFLIIVEKETRKKVLSYNKEKDELLLYDMNEKLNDLVVKITNDKNGYKIEKTNIGRPTSINDYKYVLIRNGKLQCLYQYNSKKEYNGGILVIHQYKNQTIYYSNGQEIRITDENGNFLKSSEAEMLSEIINSDKEDKAVKLEYLLCNALNESRLEQTMDDYYFTTGRELFDDIKNSNLPDDIKNKFLKEMYEPFVNSEFYNANLEIESSQIRSKYYTGDDYSIKYNGPIVIITNKSKGDTTRINLKKLFKEYNFTDRGSRRRTEKLLANDLKILQSFDGEILENIGKELSSIRYMDPEKLRHIGAVAFYDQGREEMVTKEIYHGKNIGTNIHELGHAIDNIYVEDGGTYYLSSRSKFKERYDKYMIEWENKGHKRHDTYKFSLRRILNQLFTGTNDYSVANEIEAFAICISGILGKPDDSFKYVEQNFPELIDLAKEIYLEVRNLSQDRRNPKNQQKHTD